MMEKTLLTELRDTHPFLPPTAYNIRFMDYKNFQELPKALVVNVAESKKHGTTRKATEGTYKPLSKIL